MTGATGAIHNIWVSCSPAFLQKPFPYSKGHRGPGQGQLARQQEAGAVAQQVRISLNTTMARDE
jgi:hypothetical protein